MDTVRWGIIGCGDVTEKKSGPALYKSDHSELVAVMRRNGDKARDYAARHGIAKWYDSAERLINDPDINAIYIATPPDTHCHYTLQAAAAGKPVYVEKPMARTFAECQQMITACRNNEVPLFVAYYRRSLPKFLKVKTLLDSGVIGKIRTVRVVLFQPPSPVNTGIDQLPWRVIPAIAGGGIFFDLASHTLDILDYYLGPIRTAHGFAANQQGLYPAEDVVSAAFAFENGIIGNGIWCFTADRNEDLIEITGERGQISIPTFSADPVVLLTPDGKQTFDIPHPEHIQQPHIQSVVAELRGSGECPCHGESGARTSRVLDQIIADWRQTQNVNFD